MLKQIEGSMGVALGVSLCRPEVICAYPISPQTHIVENLGTLTRQGKIEHCEYINVEIHAGYTPPPQQHPHRNRSRCIWLESHRAKASKRCGNFLP